MDQLEQWALKVIQELQEIQEQLDPLDQQEKRDLMVIEVHKDPKEM